MEPEMIINKTKKKSIAENYIICNSLSSKARGLMFSKKKNLIFIFDKEERISLHMLFVFFPIWAVYLNKDKKVVSIKKLNPFISMCYPKEKAKYIIELITQPRAKLGDILSW
jgi:uncharacterized protein